MNRKGRLPKAAGEFFAVILIVPGPLTYGRYSTQKSNASVASDTELKTGLADMKCDDGAEARLSFNALSAFSGYGVGSTPKGPASFTFGLNPKKRLRI